MLADGEQKHPQLNQLIPVQPQRFNRCPTNCRQPLNAGQVLAPTEVLIPTVLSRVEKPDEFSRLGVTGMSFHPLKAVAPSAC